MMGRERNGQSPMPVRFKELTSDGVHTALADLGVTLRTARRLQAAALRNGLLPDALPEVPRRVLAAVRERATVPRLTLVRKAVSPRDGFAKYLFRGDGPEPFEAVRIPLLHRPGDEKYVVCVSSQVGCAMGCVFCATGRLGFTRNLSTWEIVDQVIQLGADSPHPVRGVVFMGMGEPFANYDAVIRAARILSEPCGLAIAAKAITISTAGLVAGIRRFTEERQPFRLLVSMTSAFPETRRLLMPIEDSNPSGELLEALRAYHSATGRRVTLAWPLLGAMNTREADAAALAERTRGLPVKLDLMDVNDATGTFRPPTPAELDAFRDALRKHLGAPVARRYSGGADIQAACGMLAGQGVEQQSG